MLTRSIWQGWRLTYSSPLEDVRVVSVPCRGDVLGKVLRATESVRGLVAVNRAVRESVRGVRRWRYEHSRTSAEWRIEVACRVKPFSFGRVV